MAASNEQTTLGKPQNVLESARHVSEKKSLLKRLDRKSGKWGPHHPRHRLLDALWGFVRYHKRQAEELERLKKLYKNVPKSHHKVGGGLTTDTSRAQ